MVVDVENEMKEKLTHTSTQIQTNNTVLLFFNTYANNKEHQFNKTAATATATKR